MDLLERQEGRGAIKYSKVEDTLGKIIGNSDSTGAKKFSDHRKFIKSQKAFLVVVEGRAEKCSIIILNALKQ